MAPVRRAISSPRPWWWSQTASSAHTPSQPGAEIVEGRAPDGLTYRSRAQQERALQAAAGAAAAHSETSPESNNASEDGEKREDGRREPIEEDNSESGDLDCSSISRAQAAQLPDQSQVADKAERISPSQPAMTCLVCLL
jgi:hypothetical protein